MKINKIAASLALFAAASLSNIASASVTYTVFNIITPVDQVFLFDNPATAVGFFNNTYNFTLSTLSDTSTSVTNHKLTFKSKKIQNIDNIKLEIFDSLSNLLSSSSDTIITESNSVAAGSYQAVVTGFGSGTQGGAYQLSIYAEPSAVPVPAAAWLLGSGLLGLVGVARRTEV